MVIGNRQSNRRSEQFEPEHITHISSSSSFVWSSNFGWNCYK